MSGKQGELPLKKVHGEIPFAATYNSAAPNALGAFGGVTESRNP